MAQISVNHLTFCYEGSYDNIFEDVSFVIDTDWKIGFIGRNGKGKTTFLQLLQGKCRYEGSITTSVFVDYFPYEVKEIWKEKMTVELLELWKPEYEFWKVTREMTLLEMDVEKLYQPFGTLSFGERTKVMLALLFAEDEGVRFHLIDEPTNHLDTPTRKIVQRYLQKKKGFLLVSHDRHLLDQCVDHILAINRTSIQIEKGTFSSWWENRKRNEAFEQMQNQKLQSEIKQLERAAQRTNRWANKVESTKIGFDPLKEPERDISTRSYIGAKTKSMESRKKSIERRQQKAIQEKEGLLQDVEKVVKLRCHPVEHHKEQYIAMKNVSIVYGDGTPVFQGAALSVKRGERIVLQGKNGCGKSSVLKSIMQQPGVEVIGQPKIEFAGKVQGEIQVAHGLRISYVNQDTSFLHGGLDAFAEQMQVDHVLLRAVLRNLGFERVQFEKEIGQYSEGQKKKVLLATSLLQEAHLYIWDEPLNYVDIFSRMQLEEMILQNEPTMLVVEHDSTFAKKIATSIVEM